MALSMPMPMPMPISGHTHANNTDNQSPSLYNLPVELLLLIAQLLDPPDLIHLSSALSPAIPDIDHLLLNPPFWLPIRDSSDNTVLHHAAAHNDLSLLEYLISRCARDSDRASKSNPSCPGNKFTLSSIRNIAGYTPLHSACQHGHAQSSHLLLHAGLDPNTRAGGDLAPLQLAAGTGNAHLVRLLLETGADAAVSSRGEYTVLHWAAQAQGEKIQGQQRAQVAEEVLFRKDGERREDVNVNAKDALGWTPLHWAAQRGDSEMAAVLVRAGADVLGRDGDDVTAGDVAWEQDFRDMGRWLETLEGGKDEQQGLGIDFEMGWRTMSWWCLALLVVGCVALGLTLHSRTPHHAHTIK